MMRLWPANGPRSVIRTRTVFLVSCRVTSTQVPKGSVRCAAVSRFGLKTSPLAVFVPEGAEYHVARPSWGSGGAWCARTRTASAIRQEEDHELLSSSVPVRTEEPIEDTARSGLGVSAARAFACSFFCFSVSDEAILA